MSKCSTTMPFFFFNCGFFQLNNAKVPTINVIVYHLSSCHEKFLDLIELHAICQIVNIVWQILYIIICYIEYCNRYLHYNSQMLSCNIFIPSQGKWGIIECHRPIISSKKMPSQLYCRYAFYYSFHYNNRCDVYLSHRNTCRWGCSLLGDRVLQYHPLACWWGWSGFIVLRDTFQQGYRLIHIKQWMGFPAKNIFQWWELWNASPRHFPNATKW